jgi:hypothetical protein
MPSLVVHVALAALLGAALLGRECDRRSLLVVAAVPVVPDLDAFAGFVLPGTHRALLHTLLIPLALAALLYYDTQVRESSWLADRYGPRGVHVAWVAVVVYAVAGTGPDLFSDGGANPLYPLHDQFYEVSGELEYSTTRGWVQTFVDLHPGAGSGGDEASGGASAACEAASGGDGSAAANPREGGIDLGQRGSTKDVHINSGIDPTRGPECAGVERIFPVAQSGWQLLLVLTAGVMLVGRAVVRRATGER